MPFEKMQIAAPGVKVCATSGNFSSMFDKKISPCPMASHRNEDSESGSVALQIRKSSLTLRRIPFFVYRLPLGYERRNDEETTETGSQWDGHIRTV